MTTVFFAVLEAVVGLQGAAAALSVLEVVELLTMASRRCRRPPDREITVYPSIFGRITSYS